MMNTHGIFSSTILLHIKKYANKHPKSPFFKVLVSGNCFPIRPPTSFSDSSVVLTRYPSINRKGTFILPNLTDITSRLLDPGKLNTHSGRLPSHNRICILH